MTAQQDLDRALGAWLHEVPPHSDRARVSVLVQIATTPQHRRSRWAPRRTTRPVAAAGSTRKPSSAVAASRLIAAIAIVALGTGTLFFAASTPPSPVPTAVHLSPSPKPSGDRLAELITEEVASGIVRVIDDGASHALTGPDWVKKRIATGSGAVWLVDDVPSTGMTPFRLGATDAPPRYWGSADLTVGSDGTVWALGNAETPTGARSDPLLSYREGSWTSYPGPDVATLQGILVGEDGTVLVSGHKVAADRCDGAYDESIGPPVVSRLVDGEWQTLPRLPGEVVSAGGGGNPAVGPDGSIWLGIDFLARCPAYGGLFRFDGRTWEVVPDVPHGDNVSVYQPAIGRDGTLWVYATDDRQVRAGTVSPDPSNRTLARLANGAWTTFDWTDGVPELYGLQAFGAGMDVGLDGTLWIAFDGSRAAYGAKQDAGLLTGPGDTGPRAGVLSFDGTTWRSHLGGYCANDLDIADDGSVWVTVSTVFGVTSDQNGLYRITPEIATNDAPRAPASRDVTGGGDDMRAL